MRIGVIGLGLIGGSLLRALHAAGHEATGYDTDRTTRLAAVASGLRTVDSLDTWRVDVTVLAVPLPALGAVMPALDGYDGLITDVVSVKTPLRDLLAGRRFVGGHPMAGKETSGFEHSDADLFTHRVWALCLDEETSLDDWLELARLYTAMGARVVPTTAAEHDAAVAAVSHVPHLLAAALVEAAGDPLPRALAASSFRDGTRVALTRPELVAAMAGGNAAAVRAALDRTLASLKEARAALDADDPAAAVEAWFTPAWRGRRDWPSTPGPAQTTLVDRERLLELGRAGGWVHSFDDDRHITVMRPAATVP
ncbi:prephenate dehydrogenase [Phytomonospora endophytica]|uniref:Prephenate dehydrogenase n=1 Tax=Phytomonospora endophytica TaxID=714109 RepID=A0A841FD60_9ACTN|nr:prephenate dehydrogenase/arogenate dehydrogenase family protein [Phytomonospora endophytica]MBB6035221.1 prephenate dehydrogenase [Phytomonospora endophytica]